MASDDRFTFRLIGRAAFALVAVLLVRRAKASAMESMPMSKERQTAQLAATESWHRTATSEITRSWVSLLKQTYQDWVDDKAPRLGAALAYYSIFSLAPLLVVALTVAGFFFDSDRVFDELDNQLSQLLGADAADAIQEMLRAAQKPARGAVATAVGLCVLLWGASGVFAQLQDALNTIWEVKPKAGRGVWRTIKSRFLSFTMVLGTGFLLLISLVLTTAIQAVGTWSTGALGGPDWVFQAMTFVGSFVLTSVLFAMIFKFVPDAIIQWRDVWIGAAVTGALFVVGKWAIGLYLTRGDIGSAFGSAASFVLVLVWIYYSAQILFLGAEFTQVFASMYGSRVIPSADAEPVTRAQR